MNSQLTIAVHILAVLANREGQGAVTSEEIAEGFSTNPVVIRRVMSLLKKAELVSLEGQPKKLHSGMPILR